MLDNIDLSRTKVFETILKTKPFKNELLNNNYGFYEGMKIPGLPNTIYICSLSFNGGFASIHKIYNNREKKYYAMKIPHKKYYNQTQICRMFLEEANRLSLIEKHTNIVNYKNFINWNNVPLIITSLIDGFSLDKLLSSEKNNCYFMRISDYLAAFIEIARGMAFLHEDSKYNILHLDLKPSNIMFDITDSSLKIIDFGISRTLIKSKSKNNFEYDEAKTRIIGTYPYMSPEHFDGIENCNKTSDIYSMGVIIYEIITKNKPFLANNKEEYSKLHKTIEINSVPGCTPELESIIVKCLKKESSQRYQNFYELLSDLNSLYFKLTNSHYPKKVLEDVDDELILKANRSLNAGQLSQSLNNINDYLKLFPKNIEALISKAFILYKRHSYTEALKAINNVLFLDKNNLKGLVVKGHILVEKEEFNQAINCYSYVLKKDPISYLYIKGSLAQAYFYNMEISKATNYINMALSDDKHQFDFISVKSRILFLTNNEEKAISFIEKFLDNDWEGNFHSLWGNALNDIGKGHSALNKLTYYSKKYTETANICHTIGNIYFKMQQYSKALIYYKKSYLKDLENILYLDKLLLCYCMLEKVDDINSIFSEFTINNILNGAYYNSFGNAFLNIKEYEKSIICFQKSIEIEPENANFATTIILYYIEIKEYSKCNTFIKTWLNSYTPNSNFLNALGLYYYYKLDLTKSENFYKSALFKSQYNSLFASNLLNLYLKTDSLKEALEFSVEWLKNKRGCEHFHYTLGKLYYKNNLLKNAITSFKNAHSQNPYNLIYTKILIEAYLKSDKSDKLDKASKIANIFLNLHPKDSKSYYSNEIGISFLSNNFFYEAMYFFKKSIEFNLNNIHSAINIICSYRLMKKYNEAISFSNKWIQNNITNDFFWIQCGYVYHETENFYKSYDCFKKALFIKPNIYESLRYFLFSIVKIGKYSEGVEYATNWLLSNEATIEINNLLGLCYYNLKLFAKALKCFGEIISIEESNPYHCANYICTLLYLKKDDAANNYITTWSEKNNPNDYFYNTLGLCYLNLAMYEKSTKNFKNALNIKPDNESYAHNYFKSLRHISKIDEALSFAKNWRSNREISSDFLNHIGLCYFEKNMFSEASDNFLEALSNTPDNATIAANYIVSLTKIKKIDEALKFSNIWVEKYTANELFSKVYTSLKNKKNI
ncbi:MAG: protein kinase [Clostridiales bacterium]